MNWVAELQSVARRHGFQPAARQFYFLRHGQTAENNSRICQGQRDVPLDATGIQQASCAAAILKDQPVQKIVSSDLRRVTMTIDPLIALTDWPVAHDQGLRERTFGVLEGHPIPDDLWNRKDDGVEPIPDFAARVLSAADRAASSDNILIAAHGGILRVLAAAMAMELQPFAFANALPLVIMRNETGFEIKALINNGQFDTTKPLPQGVEPPSISTGVLMAATNTA